ncbi:MAG: IMCp domain-containing protein [Treponema sp.]|nr:IMCp domain-containing protein [Treponema sp.]
MANKKAFFILTVFLIFSSVSFAQKSKKFSQKIEWTKDNYATKYELQVQVLSGGKYSDFFRTETEKSFVNVSFPAGTYRYRITQFDLIGRKTEPSKWFPLEIVQAVQPILSASEQKTYYFQKERPVEITILGSGFTEKSKFTIIDENTNELPCSVIIQKAKSVTLSIQAKNVKDGKFLVKVKNPPNLSATGAAFSLEAEKTKSVVAAVTEPDKVASRENGANSANNNSSINNSADNSANNNSANIINNKNLAASEKSAEQLIEEAFLAKKAAEQQIQELSQTNPQKAKELENLVTQKLMEVKEIPVVKEVIVEKEVIKEVPVEVEKIVEKEVIKEVPVEVEKIVEKEVIKEVPSSTATKDSEEEVEVVEKKVKEVVVKEIVVEEKIITKLDHSEIKISAGPAAYIGLYNDTLISHSDMKIPIGVNVQLSFIPVKNQKGFFGANLDVKHFLWTQAEDSYFMSITQTFTHLMFDYERAFFKDHLRFGFEIGPGINIISTEVKYKGSLLSDATEKTNPLYISAMAQFSIYYVPVKSVMIKLQADYTHIFAPDMPTGLFTPALTIGFRL